MADEETRRFQRAQQEARLRHSEHRENIRHSRSQERDFRRQAEREKRDADRRSERAVQRKHANEMYEIKRQDRLSDLQAQAISGIEEQKEISRREIALLELGTELYRKKLNDDYVHDIRTRNLDIQEYQKRVEIDISHDDNTAKNEQREIRERLKAYVIERLTDHAIAENEKSTTHTLELERMDRENVHEVRKIREESSARDREIWAKNEADKDFELFMHELKQSTATMSDEELEASYNRLKKTGKLSS